MKNWFYLFSFTLFCSFASIASGCSSVTTNEATEIEKEDNSTLSIATENEKSAENTEALAENPNAESVPDSWQVFGEKPAFWNITITGDYANIRLDGKRSWQAVKLDYKTAIENVVINATITVPDKKQPKTIAITLTKQPCETEIEGKTYEWSSNIIFSEGDYVKRYYGCGKVE